MRHGTIITAIALAALTSAACANGPGGINGPAVDQVIDETHRDGTVFSAELTYAERVGRKYIAFLTLEWGNPDVRVGRRGRTPVENFDGTVEVDDGIAQIIDTPGFESGGRRNQRAAQRIYDNEVQAAERRRQQFVRATERQWEARRTAAINRYRNRRRLRAALNDIDDEFERKIDQYDRQARRHLVDFRRRLDLDHTTRGDRIVHNNDDEVEWESTTHGDTDGVVIRLVLDDPETEIEIEVGDVDIELDTQVQPHRGGGRHGGGNCCDDMDRCTHGRRGHQAHHDDDDDDVNYAVVIETVRRRLSDNVTHGTVQTRAPGRAYGAHLPSARRQATPGFRRLGQQPASSSSAAIIAGAIRLLFD